MPQATIQTREKTTFEISDKQRAKKEFCQNYGLNFDKKTPLISISCALSDKNNIHLIQEIMEGILEQEVILAITAIGTKAYQDYFTLISEKYPHQVVIVNDNRNEKSALYSASDMILCASKSPECIEEIVSAMAYGTIPLCPENERLVDYDPNQENGNAFIQKNLTHWGVFSNLIRAIENFHFPYDWKNIMKSAMKLN